MGDETPAPVPETKKPWLSKTILLNSVLAIVGGVAQLWPPAHVVLDWINSHGSVIVSGLGALNIGLRWITKDKISLSD